MNKVVVVGGGLAGCEAAYQLALRGVEVELYEMRPHKQTPAHKTDRLAELVCSNSLRAASLENAVGLLKEEMRRLDSLIMRAADATKVAAGAALACDREAFSAYIQKELESLAQVNIRRQEVGAIPEGITVIAAGPLVADDLAAAIGGFLGAKTLFFHDAIAPLVYADSIDQDKAFFASRYDKGEGDDYLNCPLTEEEYLRFYRELQQAELHPLHDFEDEKVFEGCMPIEVMAKRGLDTMRFGPLKPVGLRPPDGSEPYAVVQLRRDNAAGSLYNMVGFQTRLTFGEQQRVFGLIPALAGARYARFGTMHRNTYLDSPRVLCPDLCAKKRDDLFFAGQLMGVEGYVESAAAGLVAGINAAARALDLPTLVLPRDTAVGSLLRYTTTCPGSFQPMNVNFGLMPPLEQNPRKKRDKNALLAQRALSALAAFKEQNPQHFAVNQRI